MSMCPCVRVSVCPCVHVSVRPYVTLFKRTLKMSSSSILKSPGGFWGKQAGRQAGRQAVRQAGRQAGKQAGRQASRQGGRQAGRQAGRQVSRQVSKKTSRQEGRKAGRQALGRHSVRAMPWRGLFLFRGRVSVRIAPSVNEHDLFSKLHKCILNGTKSV